MTFNYTPGGTSDRDRIRIRIGDTDSSVAANQRLEDEEIADFLTTEGAFRSAAAASARALAAKFMRLATQRTTGTLTLVWQARADSLLNIADELSAGVARTVVPLAGGMSISEKVSDATDSDLVQPAFARNQFDNPEAVRAPSVDPNLVVVP